MAANKKVKHFWSKYIPYDGDKYSAPIKQEFSESHVGEANPHLIRQTDLDENGIGREAAEFLIAKWNNMAKNWIEKGQVKYVYWLDKDEKSN